MNIYPSGENSFGHFKLPLWREKIRQSADRASSGKLGRWMVSLLRKLCFLGSTPSYQGPVDVVVANGVHARLYPASNRCEKRAVAGVHLWDAVERDALNQALVVHQRNTAHEKGKEPAPFVFLDVGANVGLYTLFVQAKARELGVKTRLLAVEPDIENRRRLMFNFKASGCDGEVETVGISGSQGVGVLTKAHENRGGISVLDVSDDGQEEKKAKEAEVKIVLETLPSLFKKHDLSYINAMKIDIEGRDEAALSMMVAQAPQYQWPQLVIVETGRVAESTIIEMMVKAGYRLQQRVGINAILVLDDIPRKDDQG